MSGYARVVKHEVHEVHEVHVSLYYKSGSSRACLLKRNLVYFVDFVYFV